MACKLYEVELPDSNKFSLSKIEPESYMSLGFVALIDATPSHLAISRVL
jgi:hypothetical protein